MELYQTEEQQVEAIKSFWRTYGGQILAGVVIGLGGIYGFRYYQDTQVQDAAEAAAAFAQAGDTAQLETFVSEYKDSSYAVIAELKLAKTEIEAGEYDKAAGMLDAVVKSATVSESIKTVARIRLARVNIERGQLDAAITDLQSQWPETVSGEVKALLGDALVLKGDTAAARTAYQEALMSPSLSNAADIQIRLDDLAEPTEAVILPVTE
ncbi:YfgM family protein [Echinimonas agarilytica]|uniref:Ancillary SecYEG translocon subunit n=1 Tax=Echinimonas agarilytica TaxID=1215918 RepID=A0AA41W6Y7_9GAMM|nr:tetratricopeptide repeat protein [Echinimonas agarilytica]